MAHTDLVSVERIEKAILLIRGHKVLLDRDLAALYGIPAKRLNEQVTRNRKRFPEDFMFQLTAEEAKVASAFEIANCDLYDRVFDGTGVKA